MNVDTTEDSMAYPDPPWRLHGQHWGGLFRTDQTVDASEIERLGGKPLFKNRLGVAVLRYKGELEYDELIVTVPVRFGLSLGVWIRDIWVSKEQSKQGGIQIWNLPKAMAEFAWDNDCVTISDAGGLVAELRCPTPITHWPWAFTWIPTIGTMDGTIKRANARWRGKVSLTAPQVNRWSDRFTERIERGKALGFSSAKLSMTVPAPSR